MHLYVWGLIWGRRNCVVLGKAIVTWDQLLFWVLLLSAHHCYDRNNIIYWLQGDTACQCPRASNLPNQCISAPVTVLLHSKLLEGTMKSLCIIHLYHNCSGMLMNSSTICDKYSQGWMNRTPGNIDRIEANRVTCSLAELTKLSMKFVQYNLDCSMHSCLKLFTVWALNTIMVMKLYLVTNPRTLTSHTH